MPNATPAPERVDDRLTRLLDVERRLELRVQAAERDARERLEAVRAAAQRTSELRMAELQEAARQQEQADLDRHAAELARVEAEGAEHLRRLSSLSDETVERLAARVYARVIGRQGRGGPP
jgi:hypothetical protein